MEEKEILITMIENVFNMEIIHYLYQFTSDFITAYSFQQTIEPSAEVTAFEQESA